MDPTLAGYVYFLFNIAGIPTAALSSTAPIIAFSFNYAMDKTYKLLACLPNYDPSQPTLYAQAIYNLATDNLINFAPDTPPSTYFADLRKNMGLNSFIAGVISSSSDQGTSQSLDIPNFFKTLTLSDLQLMKTPFGRQYLAIAQSTGPLWGLT